MNLELLKQYKAKSESDDCPKGISIYEHIESMISLLKQLELPQHEYMSMVKIIKYHDIGKIVDSFQNDIESKHRDIRHEILSASVKDLTDIERIAILTHHKNWDKLDELFWSLNHSQYQSELKEIENKLGIEMIDINTVFYNLKENNLLKEPLAIKLKGYLNLCDHLSSAGVTTIDKGFDVNDGFLFENLNTIQQKSKTQKQDIIIIGPTGSGKTEASLYWSDNLNPNKNKRIYYLLPYTASINAMYERLKAKDVSVGMLHSKAEYFLYQELNRMNDDNKKYNDEIDNSSSLSKQSKHQYQMFKYFTKQITVATIHQIFKAVFNCKFNEMMLSMYSNSLFIIDEIHCYDEKQLAIILVTLRFLRDNYNINICIMSASIPTKLLNLIKEELGIEKVLRLTEEENNKIRRHRINYIDSYIDDSLPDIIRHYKNNHKIIICCNEVDKAIDMYKKIINSVYINKEDVLLIHSRFIHRDREKIEKKLAEFENMQKGKKILIGTQAIEVSLNIDYDFMFTEISPIDSQIQRWGRVNRNHWSKLEEIKDIYVFNYDGKVYPKPLLERTLNIIKNIDIVNENNVQDYLDQAYNEDFNDYHDYKYNMLTIANSCILGKWVNKYNEIQIFNSISVLPSCFIDEYNKLISEENYHEANSYFVSISTGAYLIAKRDNAITEPCNKGITPSNYVHVIYYDYNENMGLLLKKFDKLF